MHRTATYGQYLLFSLGRLSQLTYADYQTFTFRSRQASQLGSLRRCRYARLVVCPPNEGPGPDMSLAVALLLSPCLRPDGSLGDLDELDFRCPPEVELDGGVGETEGPDAECCSTGPCRMCAIFMLFEGRLEDAVPVAMDVGLASESIFPETRTEGFLASFMLNSHTRTQRKEAGYGKENKRERRKSRNPNRRKTRGKEEGKKMYIGLSSNNN